MYGEQIAKLIESAVKYAEPQAAELIDEFLNFMIFVNTMSALRSIAVIFIGWLIVKSINAMIKVYKEESNIKMVSALDVLRATIITAVLAGSIYMAYSPMKVVAKILIAPKVFLIEEGAEFFNKNKAKP